MARLSPESLERLHNVQSAVDALNGEFDLMKEALKRDGLREVPSWYPSKDDFARAAARPRSTFTRWVNEWWKVYETRPAWPRNPDRQAAAFLAARPRLFREVSLMSRLFRDADPAGRLSEPMLRALLGLCLRPDVVREVFFPESDEWWRRLPRRLTHLQVKNVRAIVDLMVQHGGSISGCPTMFAPDNKGDNTLIWPIDFRRTLSAGAAAEAARHFILLLRSRWRLGKCSWCERFFVDASGRRGKGQHQFCSRDCAQKRVNQRLSERLQTQRDTEKQLKIRLARAAIARYERLPVATKRGVNWKAWVAAHATKCKGLRITKKFLTHVINDELLSPPKMKGASKR